MGKPRLTISFDEDLYEDMLARSERTGKAKGEVVNDRYRQSLNGGETKGNTLDSFVTVFGQSLFVAGPLIALLSTFGPGLGVMALGLGLMVWGSMQQYVRDGHSHGEALKLTLGVA